MASLASVFNHLVLPPQIPGEQDADMESISKDVLVRLIQATVTLGRLAGQEQASTWHAVRQSLRCCQSLHLLGRLEKQSLVSEFQLLKQNEPLVLHIQEQNAALIIRRDISGRNDLVIFEAFETSPPSAEVLASEGALVWDFPDCAAQISFGDFQKPSFQDALADFLEKSGLESLKHFQAHTTKAQTSIVESRDTASPALVTHLLIPLLEAIGSPAIANVPRLRKRVRDDVNINATEFAWRRVPFWLVVRVFTQRQLQLSLGDKAGRAYYKFLIATLLVELLKECPRQLAPEMTMTLRAKICRRLAKLEQEKHTSPAVYNHLFTVARPFFKTSIEETTTVVKLAWDKFKRETTRPIPRLSSRADRQSLYLSLPNSGPYLQNVLNLPRTQNKVQHSWNLPTWHDSTIEQVELSTDKYFKLAKLEHEIETQQVPQSLAGSTPQSRCIKLAEAISDLFNSVGVAYDSNPEQMSIFILNLFALWMRLDKDIIQICPLLSGYHPVFTPELLDALHLPTASDMQRLQDIQIYLQLRCKGCMQQKTIFSEPDKHSFTMKYVTQSVEMQARLQEIQEASDLSRQAKTTELVRWQQKYDEHSSGISVGTCVCTINHDGSRNVRGCTKCWHWRKRNRMDIYAHEDFLPRGVVKTAAVVFELCIPSFITAYRNATWKIFQLGYPDKPTSVSPTTLLKDYEPLKAYGQRSSTGISIASTSKPFLGTHYKVAKKKMRASEADVLYPNGLTFFYFDLVSNTWVKDFDKPLTFHHVCGVHVPPGLRDSVMPESIHPPTEMYGLSSYEIVASETKCPSNMSVHEFTTYQRLLSGKARRWLTMLVELGASNLNFSSESTMQMFNHLATQAGPARDEPGLFRDIHVVFKDASFCHRLTEQIGIRLRNITSNWREVHCMEVLITLSLRLFTLVPSKTSAKRLLEEARVITLQWITRLRTDARSTTEASVAETAARYAFWAALLCRRTFSTFAEVDEIFSQDDLSIFVQASLALQENLVVDLVKLPPLLKNMLIRDTKMAYTIQSLILRSIRASPKSIGMAINASWLDSGNSTAKVFAEWQVLKSPHDRWIVTTMAAATKTSANSQVVHYNFIEGHLLIDGKPLGKLPRDIRESNEVKELFGNHHLLTFPSAEVGMSHVVATRIQNHEIHFGIRNGKVIIRARARNGLFEYIPSNLFAGFNNVDLPLGLVSNCVHWLNLHTKCIEVRRKTVPWRTRLSDWIIDVVNRRGNRRGVSLVDPNSMFFKQVADIFRHFEDPRRITVFQPISARGMLSVELRHLELSFFVNSKGLLQCRELGEEIDPDQNAGTLYGLESKIVLRDVADNDRRSIIVPLGKVSTKRRGMHVAVRVASSVEYARLGIDDVLGRLSCPVEPRLLYAKAQFHAFTSFVIPDPLTGRTGTEEALHILQSGYCQPWTPLGLKPIEILNALSEISPIRVYYPKDKKKLQSVDWNTDLTVTIQHDAFKCLVEDILCKSERLRVFSFNKMEDSLIGSYAPTHLQKRGIAQRCLLEHSVLDMREKTNGDTMHISRGQQTDSVQARRVYHIVRLLQTQPFGIHTTRELSTILQNWPLIGGFRSTFEIIPFSLSDLIEKNIDEQWGSLVNVCRKSGPQDLHSLMFRLSLMSLNARNDIDVIRILAAFASLRELKELQPPLHSNYNDFRLNESPTIQSIFRIVSVDPLMILKKTNKKVQDAHRKACEAEGKRLAQHFLEQWPNKEISLNDFESDYIDTALAKEQVNSEWHRLHKNLELSEYIGQVQDILERYQVPTDASVPTAWNLTKKPSRTPDRNSVIPSLSTELLVKSLASSSNNRPRDELVAGGNFASPPKSHSTTQTPSKEANELQKILFSFTSSSNSLRQQYGRDLEMSLTALGKTSGQPNVSYTAPNATAITEGIPKLRTMITAHFTQIRNALSSHDDRFQWLDLGDLWPCNTSMAMLEQLRSSSNHVFGSKVKEAIVSHGVLVTNLQRLVRIRNALYHEKHTRLQEELINLGHENWDPSKFPDWLLLEVDSDIMIRREQIDVAHAIIAPKSGENTVLQLNMGKGKTSCIVPMAMAILGNGKQLSRLIVPKPLLLPTAQMIQSRLGGLVGREIRHIPFSRRTNTDPDTLQLYKYLHQDLLRRRGVVLNAPEHVLSYKLSGLQHLADSKLNVAREMIDFQSWLNSTCRDVLDESDVSLAVKTQLIYPSGEQTTVDGHPHRWQVVQSLLSLVENHLPYLRRKFPRGIEIIERGHGYPMMFFLKPDVEDDLHGRIIDDICAGRTAFLRFADSTSSDQPAEIRKVLLDTQLDDKAFKRVAALFADKNVASKNLLLVRGLLLNRILLLCLKKRWNVQYGLHPQRDPIAVPFEAKSVPSEQAEFGHPDVAIILTCLAFYYSGLRQDQFSEGLCQILSSHDPSSEYDRWISGCDTLPEALHHWNVINVDDQGQLEELWKHLRTRRTVLDHYMNHFVFPAHAKQFGIKLQASGWELPLFPKIDTGNSAATLVGTTGFSGTNDNKIMLPLTIRQNDLPSLHQTNAEVLTSLLQYRNREYHLAAQGDKRLSERGLLEQLLSRNIRVLIDAGAYILEMDNETLVKTWLEIDIGAQAAVFFSADNRAMVRYRGTKNSIPLLATAFVDNLDKCLVYLDEAHTRGVDLKLPQYARGALTLALGQTKDHTVQAAMRLRKLASTQSVSFFAFPEIHQSILDVCNMNSKDRIDSSHVVHWLLEQTCCANEQLQNLYIAQGINFCNRTDAEWKNADFISNAQNRKDYVTVLHHPEQQTLEQLYGNHTDDTQRPLSLRSAFPQVQAFMEELNKQRRAAAGKPNALHSSALEEVEQEREVEFQVEEVREVQRPVHYKALEFPGLHRAISTFMSTGVLSGAGGYEHVFAAVSRTSVGQKFRVADTKTRLFVSTEYMKTIQTDKNGAVDNFQRPVEWILYCPSTSTALILIAEEAELLIPKLRIQKPPAKVHLLMYSAPVTKRMLRFSVLAYHALPSLPDSHIVPHWLTTELGIFAGRLYMGFDECAPLIEYIENNDNKAGRLHGLGTNPISFLLEWLSLRRKGQDIMHTPIGYICQGRPLDREHAFFTTLGADKKDVVEAYRVERNVDEASEEEKDDEDEWDSVDEIEMA